mgnify:CR=1 FL=1
MTMVSRAKSLPADERRAVTVEAVVQLAAERNPNDITTASIATRMGLTHGALFRHFPTKDAILQAVMEWVAERLLSRVNQAAESTTSPVAALEAIFMTHVDFVVEHPGVPRIMFGELQRAEKSAPKRLARTLVQKYGQRLQKLVEAGKAQGQLNVALDSKAAAILFIGAIHLVDQKHSPCALQGTELRPLFEQADLLDRDLARAEGLVPHATGAGKPPYAERKE